MLFRKFRTEREIAKLRQENPYLFDCNSYSNFEKIIANPTKPARTLFDAPPFARGKFFFMPDKTINIVDIDFGNVYENLTPAKWWINKLDEESFELHFECPGFPFDFLFLDLFDEEKSDNLVWFETNFPNLNKKKSSTRKGK